MSGPSLANDFDGRSCTTSTSTRSCANGRLPPVSPPPRSLGLNDYQHLERRLGSLCLEAAEHPISPDKRSGLAVRGARAVFRAPLPRRRRALLAAWFLCVGLLPRRFAGEIVAWHLEPSTRPKAVQRVLQRLRRLTC